MKKHYPTHFDETAQLHEEIAVSAGARGHQMILPPDALVSLVDGDYHDLIQ
jgi:prolyl-tRNA editing enzyme YbaK/EbsC (Cys-tRNA(Pro) deacylase)